MSHRSCGILAPKKVAGKDKSKKKLPSHMFDDFHAILIGTNLKTQESNMHGKLKEIFPFIDTEETFMLYKDSEMIPMKTWRILILQQNGEDYIILCIFSEDFIKKQKIQNILKIILINSNINLFAPIRQQFWIETLNLTSSCPVYHKCK